MKTGDCPETAKAGEFVMGAMPASEREAHGRHVEACDACRVAVAEARRVVSILQSAPPVRVSRDMAPAVLARVRATAARRAWSAGLAAAAGLALLVGAVWWIRSSGGAGHRAGPVASAAAWLCATQEPDGSWSTARWGGRPQFEVALTGLSLMALLESGDTSERLRQAVDRAVAWLSAHQDSGGRFGPAFDAELYNQGIATLALGRAYQAGRSERVREVLDRAVARIQRLQHADGGWGYENTADRAANLSITLWQIEALRLAEQEGWESARRPSRQGLQWMSRMVSRNGSFGYRQPGDSAGASQTLTAMGAAGLIDRAPAGLLPPDVSRSVRREVSRLAAVPGPVMDYYHRFFLATALEKMDGQGAARRLAAIRRELAARQVSTGSDQGSWPADDQWSPAGGRVYATAMASLSLQ